MLEIKLLRCHTYSKIYNTYNKDHCYASYEYHTVLFKTVAALSHGLFANAGATARIYGIVDYLYSFTPRQQTLEKNL